MATNPTGGTSVPLTERVKNILLQPKTEWPRIDAEPSTIGGIYTSYVIILAAIPPLAMLIGLLVFGSSIFRFSTSYLIGQAVLSYLLSLAGVYILALIIEALAPSFGGTKNRLNAFKVAAYSSTAAWVVGIVYLVPFLFFLGILGLYSFYLLAVGLPVLMKTPADKGLVYTLAVVAAAIVLYLIIGAITAQVMMRMMPTPAVPGTVTYTLPG